MRSLTTAALALSETASLTYFLTALAVTAANAASSHVSRLQTAEQENESLIRARRGGFPRHECSVRHIRAPQIIRQSFEVWRRSFASRILSNPLVVFRWATEFLSLGKTDPACSLSGEIE